MRTFRRLLALAVFVAALILGWRFAGANLQPVSIHYLLGAKDLPLWAALGVAFGLGFAIAGLGGLYQMARLSLTARRWRKAVRGLEAEVHQLRNLPLAGSDAPASSDALPVTPGSPARSH